MASALRASRDFVARAIARVRAGASSYERGLNTEGPAIKVEPFDAQNVSTPAALIKLGTSIAAAQRAKANFAAAQEGVALAKEKTRAEIARLRAEAAYDLGQGRQTGGRGAATLTRKVGPYDVGTPLTDVNADLAERRLAQSQAAEASRNRRLGRVSSAQAGLKQIDATVEREAKSRALGAFAEFAPDFQAAVSNDPAVRAKAVRGLGINPADYEAAFPAEKASMLAAVRKKITDDLLGQTTDIVSKSYEPHRRRYQAIIDEGVNAFSPDEGAGQGDPNDPLGLGLEPAPEEP